MKFTLVAALTALAALAGVAAVPTPDDSGSDSFLYNAVTNEVCTTTDGHVECKPADDNLKLNVRDAHGTDMEARGANRCHCVPVAGGWYACHCR